MKNKEFTNNIMIISVTLMFICVIFNFILGWITRDFDNIIIGITQLLLAFFIYQDCKTLNAWGETIEAWGETNKIYQKIINELKNEQGKN